ncbi:MAG: EamA family transporter [Rhodospirillaceae bacterium]|nr:MAG: EamA family transporter [Rhodospirillaceae bacterium]
MRPSHVLLMVLAQALWGANFAVTKMGLDHWPPLFFVCIRLALVALLLVPIVGLPKRAHLPALLKLCFLLGVVHWGTLFTGLTLTDAATTSIIVQIQVPISALLAIFFQGDRMGWRRWCGMAIAFAGIALIVGTPQFSGGLRGAGLILVAAIAWAVSNMEIKKLSDHMDGWRLNAWTGLLAAPMTFVMSLLLEHGQWQAISTSDWRGWSAMVYQVLIVTTLCYGIWYGMMRRYPMSLVMPFTLMEPVFGAATAVVLLGEPVGWRLVVGTAITLAGLAILVLRRPQAVAQPVGPGT